MINGIVYSTNKAYAQWQCSSVGLLSMCSADRKQVFSLLNKASVCAVPTPCTLWITLPSVRGWERWCYLGQKTVLSAVCVGRRKTPSTPALEQVGSSRLCPVPLLQPGSLKGKFHPKTIFLYLFHLSIVDVVFWFQNTEILPIWHCVLHYMM